MKAVMSYLGMNEIAVVAVMCKPHRCPHINFTGNICVYCPGGPDSDFEYSTQSYTGYEPTSMRAIRACYNPNLQTRSRVEQLKQLGHSVDKVEFIVMGGTFMALPEDYRDYFIRNLLHDALSGHTSNNVDEAVRYSERSQTKCIGITIETRPDYCLKRHLSDMLRYGCTRLEIGVQSVYEDVARDTNRGHTVKGIKSENVFCHKFNDKKCDVHQMQNMGSFVKDPEFLRRGYILEMQSRKRKAEPFTLPGAAIVSDSEPLKKKPFPESYSQRRISKMSNVIRFGNGLTHSLDLSSYKISAEVKDKLVCLLGQKFGLLFDRDYQLNNPNKLAFFESYSPLLYESDINPFSVVDLISILTPNKWLTTRAVSFAINFVSRSFQNVYTISCDANLPLVSATPRPDKQEELLKAFYQVPKHCSVLLLPLYVKAGQYISDTGRNHFILAVINFKESCFHLMDGFSPSNRKEAAIILKRIQALCQNDERYLKLSCKSYPVHKQNDIYNCGMYAIIHTNEYLEKQISSEHVQPDFPIQEVLQRLRPELCLQILEDMCMVHDRHLFCYICGDKPEDKKQLRCDLCAAVVCKSHDFHLCMMCNPGSDEVLNETNLEGSEKAQDSKPRNELNSGDIAVYQKEADGLLNTAKVVKPAGHPWLLQLSTEPGSIMQRNRVHISDALPVASKCKRYRTKHDTYHPNAECGDDQAACIMKEIPFTTPPINTVPRNKAPPHVSNSPISPSKSVFAEAPCHRTRFGRLVRPPRKLDL
ncbi:hypothetical protein QYM36_001838 [Artemia franciscana]|uniref:Elp3/MiaA/NifB-like radical SAM core domain-containing protein n=1 Tax=Artemia franciscana TaxID=6661 RepID=A0AA88LEA3_ARTSF|nr:hypothetical protein QYM36_001838 [Artemia franciscana]